MKRLIILFTLLILAVPTKSFAKDEKISTDSIIKSQTQTLKISSILEEAENYKTDVLEDLDISKVLTDAIKGKVNTEKIGKNIIKIFTKNGFSALRTIASIIVIVVIHSILKNITEGLENGATVQITYYVTYILIVTIVMKNFADIITIIKESIENLVGFTNCLIPILISLMLSTRKHSIWDNVRTYNIVCNNISG